MKNKELDTVEQQEHPFLVVQLLMKFSGTVSMFHCGQFQFALKQGHNASYSLFHQAMEGVESLLNTYILVQLSFIV